MIRYDLCVERFAISVAYNYYPWWFEVENNSLVDQWEKYGYTHGEFVGLWSNMDVSSVPFNPVWTNSALNGTTLVSFAKKRFCPKTT